MSKKDNKLKGNWGESLACEFLEKNDYKILDRNFNCSYGEIDIIAFYEGEIIFVEVKTRYQNCFGNPIEAVDRYKKKHIYHTAKYYLYKLDFLHEAVRFDVIEVFVQGNQDYQIIHTKNVILDEPTRKRMRRNDYEEY